MLIVDNDAAIVSLLTNVLTTLGFGTIHNAKDGFGAVEAMRKHKIDLVITDWELKSEKEVGPVPESALIIEDKWQALPSNGSLFLKFLRGSRQSPNPYISVIMLTGVALRDDISYARDSGVNEVIVKPVTADSLCSRILMVIQNDRPFITARNYRGPCRRRVNMPLPEGSKDRRVADIKVIKYRKQD